MVNFEDIASAHARIRGAANRTPVMASRSLNELVHAEVYLKCENFQRVGAFKFRGALNAVGVLSPEERARGVITHSSGNHAQALALAARLSGIKAVVVMPKGSASVKVEATRGYGAEVVFCENSETSRIETAQALIDRSGYAFVHPYDNDAVIAGAGTAALELWEETGGLDVVLCPVGGGGLVSGSAVALKGRDTTAVVIGVEPERADDACRSLAAGHIVRNASADTIADGLRTSLCERTFEIIRQQVSGIVTVPEAEIVGAMRFAWERMKLVVEPSGAVPLAGLLSGKIPVKDRRVGIILSGGNVDLDRYFAALGAEADSRGR